jgi:hypothetical protein
MHVEKVCVDIISRDGIPCNKLKAKISNAFHQRRCQFQSLSMPYYTSLPFFLLVCRGMLWRKLEVDRTDRGEEEGGNIFNA